MVGSAEKVAKALPTAQEMMEKLALAEADRAAEASRKHAAEETEKTALLDKLTMPSGVSINQQEPGWEATLTGLPKEMYEFWDRQLRPLGYKLKVQIVDFPGGMPGDVGITLKWA
jgi:molybdopterin-biosynthesis enzyme MoeA-like protein